MYFSFDKLIKPSQNADKKLIYENENFVLFQTIIKNYVDKHPNPTVEEVQDFLSQYINELIGDLDDKIGSTRGFTIQYAICQKLLNDYPFREKIYEKIKSEDEKTTLLQMPGNNTATLTQLSDNDEKSASKFMKDVLFALKMQYKDTLIGRDEFIDKYNSMDTRAKNKMFLDISDGDLSKAAQFKHIIENNELEMITDCLRYQEEPLTRETLKEKYINNLEAITKRLDEMGELERNQRKHNKIFSTYDMEDLEYPLDNDISGVQSVRNSFKRENLEKLSFLQLSALTSFWINRYAKILESLSNSYFIYSNDELLSNIIEGKKPEITSEYIKNLSLKQTFLNRVCDIIFKELKINGMDFDNLQNGINSIYYHGDSIEDSIEPNENDSNSSNTLKYNVDTKSATINIDIGDYIDKAEQEFGEQYTEYFNKLLPNHSNIFTIDFMNYYKLRNLISTMYQQKNFSISSLVHNLINENVANWGYVEDKQKEKDGMILIQADIPGLNMPVRLHTFKNSIYQLISDKTGNTKIPEYIGYDDFKICGRFIPSNLLLPLYDKQKKFLSDSMKTTRSQLDEQNLLEHLNYLQNPKEFPKHLGRLKIKKKNGKTIKEYKKPPTTFYDLETGLTYKKDSNGNFIEVDKER